MYLYSEIESFVSRFYTKPGAMSPKLLITPYAYTTTFLNLTQGSTATNVVNISADSDFVLLAFRHRAQIGTAQTVTGRTAPFVRMLVTDSGSNEQYTSSAIDLGNYSANGLVDHVLAYPRVVSGRSTLTVLLTNFAPIAETYTSIDVLLDGVRVRTYTG